MTETRPVRDALMHVLFLLLLPLIILVKIIITPFERPMRRTRSEVAGILRAFLEGTGSDYSWDDFMCIPIADARLDAIRRRCITLPEDYPPGKTRAFCSEVGIAVLRGYIEELEAAVEHGVEADKAPSRRHNG